MWKKIEEKSPWLPIAQEKSYQNNDIIDWYDWIDKLNREKWEIINTLKPQTIVQPIETYISWKKLIIWSLLIALFILFFLWLLWFLFPNFLQKSVTNNYTLTGITANQTITPWDENYKILTGANNGKYVFDVDKTNNKLLNSLWTEVCTSSINSCSNLSESDKPFCEYNKNANVVCWLYQVIIASWQTVPFSNTITLNALYDNQKSFISWIFEGEKKWAKQNNYIWDIILPEITKQKQWEPIVTITFQVDENWKLTVIARDYNNSAKVFEEPFQIREIQKTSILKESPNQSKLGDFYKVIQVIDWDTIKVEGVEKSIRIIWIDSPESNKTRYGKTECWWIESSNFTKERLLWKSIQFENDTLQWEFDIYWRILTHIWIDNNLYSKVIIESWYAKNYTWSQNKYSNLLQISEKKSKENKNWIWTICIN